MRRRVALAVGAVAVALGACASQAPSSSPSIGDEELSRAERGLDLEEVRPDKLL